MRRLALELRNRLPSSRRIGPHAFYARALRPGDLVFDIGAHFGQHTEAMLAAGAGSWRSNRKRHWRNGSSKASRPPSSCSRA
jgi:hypothetical protein